MFSREGYFGIFIAHGSFSITDRFLFLAFYAMEDFWLIKKCRKLITRLIDFFGLCIYPAFVIKLWRMMEMNKERGVTKNS